LEVDEVAIAPHRRNPPPARREAMITILAKYINAIDAEDDRTTKQVKCPISLAFEPCPFDSYDSTQNEISFQSRALEHCASDPTVTWIGQYKKYHHLKKG